MDDAVSSYFHKEHQNVEFAEPARTIYSKLLERLEKGMTAGDDVWSVAAKLAEALVELSPEVDDGKEWKDSAASMLRQVYRVSDGGSGYFENASSNGRKWHISDLPINHESSDFEPKLKDMLVAIRNVLHGQAWQGIAPVFGIQSWVQAQGDDGKLKPFFVAYRGSNAVATGGMALNLVALQSVFHMKEQNSGPMENTDMPVPAEVITVASEMLSEYTECDKIAKRNEKEAKVTWDQNMEETINDAAQFVRIRELEDEEEVMREVREFKGWLEKKLGTYSISTIFVVDMRTRKPTTAFCEKRISQQLCPVQYIIRIHKCFKYSTAAFCQGGQDFAIWSGHRQRLFVVLSAGEVQQVTDSG